MSDKTARPREGEGESGRNDMTETLSLERPSKRRRVPSEKTADAFAAGKFLDAHFAELKDYVIGNLRPKVISANIKRDYGVDVDSKIISNKIKNWKVNGIVKVPPVGAAHSRATDTPYPPSKCM